MVSFKSKIFIVLFLVISLFPVYKIVKAQTDGEEQGTEIIDHQTEKPVSEPSVVETATEIIDTGETDASIPEPETTPEEQKEESADPVEVEKAVEEVKAGVPKNSTLSNIVVIAEHVIKKVYKDKDELKLGSIANKLLSEGAQKGSDLEKELNKIVIKKPVVKKLTKSKGFRIKCVVLINKQALNACIEVGKKDKDWYSVFYIKSPKNWKLPQYFPELSSLSKLFPNIDKVLLDKYLNINALEFADSYFYISTMAMDEYKKFGKILKGMCFSVKVKIDNIFDIKGFDAKDCKADISWDFGSKNILPKSVNIVGSLQSGKSKLELALGLLKNSDNKFDLKVTSTGSLYTKDFAEFWLDTILADQIKNNTINKEKMLKLVPEVVLEGVTLDVNWPAKEGDAEGEKRKIDLKVKKTNIQLGEFVAGLMPTSAAGLKDELDKVAVKKMVAKYYKGGFRISSKIDINKKLVKSVLEVAREDGKEDGKWYSLFYIKSPDIKPTPDEIKEDESLDGEASGVKKAEKLPETWKLSEFVPDFLTAKKLFKNMDKTWLDKFATNPDLFEFSESFFYISTVDMTVSDKIGKVVKGVGFKGKAKFIGALEFVDTIFSLDGKPLEVSGNITSKFTDSDFSIKIPKAIIVPEELKIPGSKTPIKLIPGFKVEAIDQIFKIKFVKGFPEFSGESEKDNEKSGIIITVPYEKDPLKFKASISLQDKKLKLSGEQKTKMSKLFSVDGLVAEGCKVDMFWDVASFNPVPKDLNIKGKISSGSSNLNLDLNFALDDEKKVDLLVTATGDLLVKDFAKFWLEVIVKNPDITKKVLPRIPNFKFEDVAFTGKWAEKEEDRKLSLKVKKADVPLGEFVRILMDQDAGSKAGSSKTEAQKTLASYLDTFKITKAGAQYYKGGLKVNSTVNVNGKPVKSVLEIAKEDGAWYALYYIKSPDIKSTEAEIKEEFIGDGQEESAKKTVAAPPATWLVSDYLPDLVTVKKLLPDLDFGKLENELKKNKDIWALVSKPDVFEFSESLFYISTLNIKKHEKIGLVAQGAGFKSKVKFIGIFDILNKIFVLDKPLELTGEFTPKLVGSKFSVKIPTSVTIFPEVLKIPGKPDVPLIKGFQVDLAPSTLAIQITEDIPSVQVEGSVSVKLPPQILKEKLVLSSGMKFSGTAFTLTAGQKTPLKDVFGINGFDLDAGKIGLTWDLAVSSQWGEAAAAATAAIGGVGVVATALPVGFVIEGGFSSGKAADKKSNLSIKADCKFDAVKTVDIVYTSSGSLYAQDFAKFWVNVLDKTSSQQAKDAFVSKVPPFIFKDISIDAKWSKGEEKKFDLSVGQFELIPGQSASMNLKVTADGISGSGSISPVFLPGKKDAKHPDYPIITLTKAIANKTEGPSFSVDCKVNPLKIALKADAGLILNLPAFKNIESETKIDVSDSGGIELFSNTKLLDYASTLTITGKLSNPINIDNWEIVASFDKKATDTMGHSLKDVSIELLKTYKEKSDSNKEFIERNCTKAQNDAIKKIKERKEAAKAVVANYFNNQHNALVYEENRLYKIWKDREADCNGKPAVEKPACYTFWSGPELVKFSAVKAARISGQIAAELGITNIVKTFIDLGTTYVSKAEQFFAALSPTNIENNFKLLAGTIDELFNKTINELSLLIDDFEKKVFAINSLRVQASVAKLKEGKAPSIYYKVTIAGKTYESKLELDIKNPGNFIETIAKDAVKIITGGVAGKISDADKTAKELISKENEKTEKLIKEAEEKGKALATQPK